MQNTMKKERNLWLSIRESDAKICKVTVLTTDTTTECVMTNYMEQFQNHHWLQLKNTELPFSLLSFFFKPFSLVLKGLTMPLRRRLSRLISTHRLVTKVVWQPGEHQSLHHDTGTHCPQRQPFSFTSKVEITWQLLNTSSPSHFFVRDYSSEQTSCWKFLLTWIQNCP